MTTVRIPANGWKPRKHQRKLWNYLQSGGKRAAAIWHRRAGKDEVALNWACVALQRRIGAWWHCLPEYAQARKAIWNQVNPHTGRRRIDEAFPIELRKRTLEHEMFIEFHNGSTWQVIGSDNYNHLVGASPLGVTFSEWAIARPAAWAYFAPILDENDGTAIFITTPRGKNHAYNTYQAGIEAAAGEWFAEIQSVVETGYSLERVEKQRKEYQKIFGEDAGDALIEQEFGSVYGREISQLRRMGRVRHFQINPAYPVHRAWDLGRGKSDAMSVWFFQWIGGEVRYVDYAEGFQHSISWMADIIKSKGYPKGTKDDPAVDYVPHDAKVASMELETTRIKFMIDVGLNPKLIPDHYVEDRHSAGRHVLRRAWFHPRCAEALEVLAAYQYEYDEKILTFLRSPKHNYASHNADAFGYSAVAWSEPKFQAPASGKGRVAYIMTPDDPEFGMTIPDRPQVTLDDLWAKHREQLNRARNERR
jgi:phage terminase large subunit